MLSHCRDLRWQGKGLPADVQQKLSPAEQEFFKAYDRAVAEYQRNVDIGDLCTDLVRRREGRRECEKKRRIFYFVKSTFAPPRDPEKCISSTYIACSGPAYTSQKPPKRDLVLVLATEDVGEIFFNFPGKYTASSFHPGQMFVEATGNLENQGFVCINVCSKMKRRRVRQPGPGLDAPRIGRGGRAAHSAEETPRGRGLGADDFRKVVLLRTVAGLNSSKSAAECSTSESLSLPVPVSSESPRLKLSLQLAQCQSTHGQARPGSGLGSVSVP